MTFSNLLALGSILVWASSWAATTTATASPMAKPAEEKAPAMAPLSHQPLHCQSNYALDPRLDSGPQCRILNGWNVAF